MNGEIETERIKGEEGQTHDVDKVGSQKPRPQEAKTYEWDNHVTIYPGLWGTLLAYTCYLSVIVNSTLFSLRSI